MRQLDMTVIIPVHNAASYIEETLESVFAQTTPPTQVIVVDDASTDESRDIVCAFTAADGSRPRLLTNERSVGVARARNRAVASATTKWIALCDNDDLWHPRRLELVAQRIAENGSDQPVATSTLKFALEGDRALLASSQRRAMVQAWVPPQSVCLPFLTYLADAAGRQGATTVSRTDLETDTCFATTQVVMTREDYITAGGCAPWCFRADDWILNACLAIDQAIDVVDLPLVFYRIRASAQSHAQAESQYSLLVASIAIRLGGARPSPAVADGIYNHVLRNATSASMTTADYLAFARLGRLPLLPAAGHLLKDKLRAARRSPRRRAASRTLSSHEGSE